MTVQASSVKGSVQRDGHLGQLYDAEGKPLAARDLMKDPRKLAALENLLDSYGEALLPRQRVLLCSVLGLQGGMPTSQTALAENLGLTRERIGTITRQALRRLIKAATAGTTPKASLGFELERFKGDTLRQAIDWGELSDEDLRREAVSAAHTRDPGRLWSLTNAYLTLYGAKGGKVSDKTREAYRRGLLDLLEAWQGENLLRPSRNAGPIYIRRLETEPYKVEEVGDREVLYVRSLATVSVKLAAARTLYKALRWADATQVKPFEGVSVSPDPISPEDKRGAYTPEEIGELLERTDTVDAAFVLLCAHGGLRIAEATSVRWRDVNWRQGEILVVGKGGKKAWVPCSDRLMDALRELYKLRPDEERILPYRSYRARERFQQVCLKAGVQYEGRGVHGLRHTAGTIIYALHDDINETADHLRHANIQTTRRYAKKDKVKRRKAVKGL